MGTFKQSKVVPSQGPSRSTKFREGWPTGENWGSRQPPREFESHPEAYFADRVKATKPGWLARLSRVELVRRSRLDRQARMSRNLVPEF